MPREDWQRIASVVTYGNSVDSCIEEAQEIAEQIKGIKVQSLAPSFPVALDKIEQLKKFGYNF